MIQIKSILLGLPQKEATNITIKPLINSTTDTTCNTYYEVKTDLNEVLASGNISLSEEEYKMWGTDNSYLDNLIISKLGLTKL